MLRQLACSDCYILGFFFHKTVIRSSGVEASSEYIRILWHYGYTLEQAIHNLKTMKD